MQMRVRAGSRLFMAIGIIATQAALLFFLASAPSAPEGQEQKEDAVFTQGVSSVISFELNKLDEMLKAHSEYWSRQPPSPEDVAKTIADLAKVKEMVRGTQGAEPVSNFAGHKLMAMGPPVLRDLIKATSNNDPNIRSLALVLVSDIFSTFPDKRRQLPVFARSLWDKDATVRAAAVGAIGMMGVQFQMGITEATELLQRAYQDKDRSVSEYAAYLLYQLGRTDLIPKELADKFKHIYIDVRP
jgi:HEAT repeat protein